MWKARLSEIEFDDRELAGVLETLNSAWITAGPRTEAFESRFADLTQTRAAVAVSNGTAALFLALKALGIGPGDEVLCPAMTFVATAAALLYCGADRVFVAISSLQDPTMDPVDAARKITSRTKAILPVHYGGIPADMNRLCALAESYGIFLIEDAAHAPGATISSRPCGSFGNAGCFSFFGNKNITTGEGGMITTNDVELAEQLRLLRSHGMTVSSWDRDQGRPAHYDVVTLGYNLRFDDLRAALGLVQLGKLRQFNQTRAKLVRLYNERFSEANLDVILPFAAVQESKQPAYHLYPVLFPNSRERDSVAQRLKDEGIQTSIHYPPVHHFSAFREIAKGCRLPITESFAERELTLPLYPSLSLEQVDTIAETVISLLATALK